MRAKGLVVGFAAVLWAATLPPLGAQRAAPPNTGEWPLAIANILPSGQPVIPIFESWIPYPDGIVFSFGYINLNSQEVIDIPIGPDNFIEPRQFNGFQPTHFDVAPTDRRRFGRHQSVFAVKVPKDYKGDVVWTLRVRGKSYSSPARAKSEEYGIEELESLTEAPVAPVLKFAAGTLSGRGRTSFVGGPVAAAAGKPTPLNVGIDLLERPATTVTWYHHQGAGRVTFDPKEIVIKANGDAQTSATFSEPGEYVIRVTAVEDLGSMEQHCCYSNGYIRVKVGR